MQEFLQQPETPLDSLRKQELLKAVEAQIATPFTETETAEILNLKEAICAECRPSYFNLMKAMYPWQMPTL